MNPTTRTPNDTLTTGILYMALELAQNKWHLAFGNGIKTRQVAIDANDTQRLEIEITKAKEKLNVLKEGEIISCYEAGRDGFWIHRYLEREGIKNHIVDSSSIKVDRRARRAKTDRLDAAKLLKQLIQHIKGEERLHLARVPSEADEDRRRMHREQGRLKKEKTALTNRIRSLLNLHGIKCRGIKEWESYIDEVRDWKGEHLPPYLKAELLRQIKRLELIQSQLKELESSMHNELRNSNESVYTKVKELKKLKGIGDIGAWNLIMEWFGWREFRNRREVGAAAGLVGTPHDSGNSRHEQGITKAGNQRIRALMVELAWCWLRYQPNSELSIWYKRFEQAKRFRKVGIVALARRLLIAIWRYTTMGEIPKGAELKSAR